MLTLNVRAPPARPQNIHNRVGLVLSPPLPGDIVRVIDVGDTPTPAGDPAHPARALAEVVPGADALRVSPPACGAPPRGGAPLAVAAARWSADPAVIAAARAYMAAKKGQVQVDPAAVGVWEFTLPGAGAAGVAVGDAVQFDRRASAGARVLNNRFHDSYGSCVRLQASGTLVEGNAYERVPGGISVVYDDPWLEGSTDIANVRIRDNYFAGVLWPHATEFSQILHADKGVANLTAFNNTVRP